MKILFWICAAGLLAGIIAVASTITHGQIVTDASDRVPWGIDAPLYMFLAGASAGSFLIASLSIFGFQRFKAVERVAVLQALVLLGIAPLFLIVGMGRPERFYMIHFSPNPTSVIAWGAYILALYPIVGLIYGYYLVRRDLGSPLSPETVARHDRRARLWGLLGIPLALAVGTYTGVLLGFVNARPLWHTALMPVLFLTSAVLSGVALLVLILTVMNRWTRHKTAPDLIRSLARLMLVLLVIDTFFLACEFLTGTYIPGSEHREAWAVLFRGLGGWMFLGVEVLLGIVVPVVLLSRGRETLRPVVAASVFVLIGVFAMRCNLILGGQVVQAYGGQEGEYFPTLHEWLVSLGLVSLGGILYILGGRFLPLTPARSKQVEGAIP